MVLKEKNKFDIIDKAAAIDEQLNLIPISHI